LNALSQMLTKEKMPEFTIKRSHCSWPTPFEFLHTLCLIIPWGFWIQFQLGFYTSTTYSHGASTTSTSKPRIIEHVWHSTYAVLSANAGPSDSSYRKPFSANWQGWYIGLMMTSCDYQWVDKST
jgi:hypothetical protein